MGTPLYGPNVCDLKKYELTIRGKKLALLLKDLIDLVENTWDSSLEIIQNQKS